MASRKPALPENCYWRGGTIYCCIEINGRRYKRSLRTDDSKLAQELRDDWIKRLKNEVIHGRVERTFDEAYASWAEHIQRGLLGDVGPRTVERYVSSISQLQPYLESV